MIVVQLGTEFKELAKNKFDSGGEFSTTPAISKSEPFVRSTKPLLLCRLDQ